MRAWKRSAFAACASLLFVCAMIFVEQMLAPPYWVKAALKALAAAAAALSYAAVFHERPAEAVFLRRMKPARALLLTLGAAMLTIWVMFFLLRGRLDLSAIRVSLAAKEHLTRGNCLFVFAYIILVNSFLEEALFRGLVTHAFRREGRGLAGAAYSALLFAVYHLGIVSGWFSLPVLLLCIVGLAGAGLFLQFVCERWGSLRASWLVHGASNLAINAIGAYLMFFVQ